MELLHPQLAAFAAVLDEGSFELAARRLSVTSSAISQRIKALEDRLGQVLVLRTAPCRATRPASVCSAGCGRCRCCKPRPWPISCLTREWAAPRARCPSPSTTTPCRPGCCPHWPTCTRRTACCSTCMWMTRTTPWSCCALARYWVRSPPNAGHCKAAMCSRWAPCATTPSRRRMLWPATSAAAWTPPD